MADCEAEKATAARFDADYRREVDDFRANVRIPIEVATCPVVEVFHPTVDWVNALARLMEACRGTDAEHGAAVIIEQAASPILRGHS